METLSTVHTVQGHDYVETLEARLANLEQKVVSLEVDRDRLLSSLKKAVEMAIKNPMIRVAIPKHILADLEKVDFGTPTKK